MSFVKKFRWSRLIFAVLFALDTAVAFGAGLAGEECRLQQSTGSSFITAAQTPGDI